MQISGGPPSGRIAIGQFWLSAGAATDHFELQILTMASVAADKLSDVPEVRKTSTMHWLLHPENTSP